MRMLLAGTVALVALALGLPAAGGATASGTAPAAPAAATLPPVNADFDYQLGGGYPPPAGVTVVTRDRTDSPAPGTYGICYVNAFQTQPGELHWWKRHHPRLLLHRHGHLLHDPGWPGEVLLNTSTHDRRVTLSRVIGRWEDGCAGDGYQAVEPDNLDSFTRSHHQLTRAENLAYATRLADRAHAAGLAIAQKNLAGLSAHRAHAVGFDFAVAEDCQVYAECSTYRAVYGGHVIEVEYSDAGLANFTKACKRRGDVWSIVYRDRELVPAGRPGYRRRSC